MFLWSQKEGVLLVDVPSLSTPKAINNKKQIAGQYKENPFERGFFHDPISGFCDIGSLGGSNTWVMDMNSKGQIVGYSETGKLSHLRDGFKEIHAFIWYEGVMYDLGVLHGDIGLGGDESVAVGISDNGDVIGYSNFALVHKGKILSSVCKALIWKNQIAEDLFPEISQSPFFSKAVSISRNGKIAAIRQTEANFFEYLAFDPSIKNLKRFSTSSGGVALGVIRINDNDVLINSFSGHCNIAKQSKQHNLYEGGNITPSNPYWEKYEVFHGINNTNKIVGTAKSMYGERHAVLIVPK